MCFHNVLSFHLLHDFLYLLTETESTEDVANLVQDDGRNLSPASGMASVMAKILGKNVNSSKSAILSKCKSDRQLLRRKRTNKSSEHAVVEEVKDLQTAKQQKDLVIKVCRKFLPYRPITCKTS